MLSDMQNAGRRECAESRTTMMMPQDARGRICGICMIIVGGAMLLGGALILQSSPDKWIVAGVGFALTLIGIIVVDCVR